MMDWNLEMWSLWRGGGVDNWKTQSNTPGVRKKDRLGQGTETETEKLFKN